jgi:hypothetical protein
MPIPKQFEKIAQMKPASPQSEDDGWWQLVLNETRAVAAPVASEFKRS